jgi:hypothetical protein
MACRDIEQSAIREARDQLFLDRADDVRLNVVTSNLGLDRPTVGTDDDEWRALAKAIALQPKQVRNIFYRLMETCVAPQKTRVGYLSSQALSTADAFTVTNPEDLVQVGTLIIDPGLATEEEIGFCYRDLTTGKVFLSSTLVNAHQPVAEAENYLKQHHNAAVTSLLLTNTSAFPTSGFPYAAIIDQGTTSEELVVVTGNNTGTNTLTIQTATAKAHNGPKSQGFIRVPLLASTVAGRTFLTFDEGATRIFPATGFVRINFGGGTVDICEYTRNDPTLSVIYLKKPLAHAHSADESVEYVSPGAKVRTVSMIQQGVDWKIQETEPRKVKLLVPETILTRRLVDASFLHDITPSATATTLTSGATLGDTTVTVASTAGFRDPVGEIKLGTAVYATYSAILSPTAFQLAAPLSASVSNGSAVVQWVANYSTTDLEEGNLRTSLGVVNPKPEWPGPYLYDVLQDSVSVTSTTLNETLPAATEVMADQSVARCCLEVRDGSAMALLGTPFTCRIGRDTGFSEDTRCTLVNLKRSTTMSGTVSSGVSTIPVTSTTGFPTSSDSVTPAGYRLLLSRGTVREEIVQVSVTHPTSIDLMSLTTKAHNNTETVEMLFDVMTFDPLLQPHVAPRINPTKVGHQVEVLHSTIKVVDVGQFSNSGTLWLNFGPQRLPVRKKVKTVISSTVLEFDDSSVFPTTDFNYQIVVAQGRSTEQTSFVTANDTVLNRLTLQTALAGGTIVAGQYVEFHAGTPLTVAYVDKDAITNTFDLAIPSVFDSVYTKGESVILSPGPSIPSEFGTDYGFRLPPSPIACVTNLLDLVRAAGVEVFVIEVPQTGG